MGVAISENALFIFRSPPAFLTFLGGVCVAEDGGAVATLIFFCFFGIFLALFHFIINSEQKKRVFVVH